MIAIAKRKKPVRSVGIFQGFQSSRKRHSIACE
jgi:hypothetical protein